MKTQTEAGPHLFPSFQNFEESQRGSPSRSPQTMSAPILLLSIISLSLLSAAEDDVTCLRDFKSAVAGPDSLLSSWNFSNSSTAFICSFAGVSCWNLQENRIIALSLPSFSLAGPIPPSLSLCSSINSLDLSGNSLSGPIPSSLCSWLPYLVSLDLSSNSLTGSIPSNLSDCRFLNSLDLSRNGLSGTIPDSLSRLDRLKKLDLSGNQLSGPIPDGLRPRFDPSSFSDNPDLCSSGSCGGSSSRTSLIIIVSAGVFGALVSLAVAYLIWRFCFTRGRKRRRKEAAAANGEEGRLWSDRLRSSHNRLLPVSLFQKPIVKVKVADLMAATADFNAEHIVVAGSSRVGTSYKVVLPDGSVLTVKRLHDCPALEKQFRVEMGKIGQIRHPNLVPLLGYCIVEEERLLVYKDMANGALSVLIQSGDENLDWRTRLRIGIGGARGLAWLHHGFQAPHLHGNLSSSSILLDEEYEPRIIDFGVARLLRPMVDGSNNTSPFLNGDFGEFGYVAPEYASHPVPSTKGDVYAFGVILLELATGQKAVEVSSDVAGEGFKGNLVDWVSQFFVAGRLREAIDKSLRGKGHGNEIVEFLKIACRCVVVRPQERPSMYKVYQSLKSIGGGHEQSEQFDEFPLVFGNDDLEHAA